MPLDAFDAGKVGLDPPMMSLDLDDTHFDIGTTDAFGGDRYVRTCAIVSPWCPTGSARSSLPRPKANSIVICVPRGSTLARLHINGIEQPGPDRRMDRRAGDTNHRRRRACGCRRWRERRTAAGRWHDHPLCVRCRWRWRCRSSRVPALGYTLATGQASVLLGDSDVRVTLTVRAMPELPEVETTRRRHRAASDRPAHPRPRHPPAATALADSARH